MLHDETQSHKRHKVVCQIMFRMQAEKERLAAEEEAAVSRSKLALAWIFDTRARRDGKKPRKSRQV